MDQYIYNIFKIQLKPENKNAKYHIQLYIKTVCKE